MIIDRLIIKKQFAYKYKSNIPGVFILWPLARGFRINRQSTNRLKIAEKQENCVSKLYLRILPRNIPISSSSNLP